MNRFYEYQTTLNQEERLEECERTITLAYFSLFDLTNRLKQIKCQKLYLPHYPTFDQYMEERWGIDQDTFVAYCKILTVVDDLLDATIPVDLFSSIPLINEYGNLDKAQRIELALKVMAEVGAGKVDKKFTHKCKNELYPDKCERPEAL